MRFAKVEAHPRPAALEGSEVGGEVAVEGIGGSIYGRTGLSVSVIDAQLRADDRAGKQFVLSFAVQGETRSQQEQHQGQGSIRRLLCLLQAAKRTEVGAGGQGRTAFGAVLLFAARLMVVYHLSAHDTRRHGHDGVAHEHDYRREHSAHERGRRYVAIAHGSHRHDCPVDARRNVGKRRTGNAAFHDIHECAHADDQYDHEEKEDAYLRCADDDGAHQQVAFLQETEELEHPKDANQAECTYDHKVTHRAEEPSDVERQRAQQVDDAKEAQSILARLVRTIETAQVLQGEEEREDVLQHGKNKLCRRRYGLQALYHDKQNTCHDADEQRDIESLSQRGVALEDDDAKLLSHCVIAHGFLPQTSKGVHAVSELI